MRFRQPPRDAEPDRRQVMRLAYVILSIYVGAAIVLLLIAALTADAGPKTVSLIYDGFEQGHLLMRPVYSPSLLVEQTEGEAVERGDLLACQPVVQKTVMRDAQGRNGEYSYMELHCAGERVYRVRGIAWQP